MPQNHAHVPQDRALVRNTSCRKRDRYFTICVAARPDQAQASCGQPYNNWRGHLAAIDRLPKRPMPPRSEDRRAVTRGAVIAQLFSGG